jgi:peptidoglycan-associated lipoprotein
MNKLVIFGLVVLFASVGGCKKQDVKKDVPIVGSAKTASQEQEAIETIAFDDEPSVRDESEMDRNLKIVYFDFDKSDLTADFLEILKENADYLSKKADVKIVIGGNTDNRGTSEYNLSLGQRRALKVKDYYVQFGIEPNRIATISYGSENPLVDENNEAAWAKNRRAETKAIKK